jgi:hypothetical protein
VLGGRVVGHGAGRAGGEKGARQREAGRGRRPALVLRSFPLGGSRGEGEQSGGSSLAWRRLARAARLRCDSRLCGRCGRSRRGRLRRCSAPVRWPAARLGSSSDGVASARAAAMPFGFGVASGVHHLRVASSSDGVLASQGGRGCPR